MQSVSSWIWTRVVVSISYDDNHYTTDNSYYYGNSLLDVKRFTWLLLYSAQVENEVVRIDQTDSRLLAELAKYYGPESFQ